MVMCTPREVDDHNVTTLPHSERSSAVGLDCTDQPQPRELVIRVRALIPYARYELHHTGQESRWRKCGATDCCSRSDLLEPRFWITSGLPTRTKPLARRTLRVR